MHLGQRESPRRESLAIRAACHIQVAREVATLRFVVLSPKHVTDLARTEWLAPSLAPFGSGVASLVPPHFEAYARVGLPGWEASPHENGLAPEVLAVLCQLIAAHHAVSDCWFAVWEGYGWVQHGHNGPEQARRAGSPTGGARLICCGRRIGRGSSPPTSIWRPHSWVATAP